MNSQHDAIERFGQRLVGLLAFRTALRWTAVWFLAWGVIVLALRIGTPAPLHYLVLGLLGALPVAIAACVGEWRRRPAPQTLRAVCDGQNRCGGLLMAAGETDVSAWRSAVPAVAVPAVRWDSGRAVSLFCAASLFVALTIFVPDRFAAFGAKRPLAIGQLIEELKSQIELLAEEKILPEHKGTEMKRELAKVGEMASGSDPAKSWEALDHLKNSTTDLARQAAEEAIAKTEKLAQAETLAAALEKLAEAGKGDAIMDKAMKDLAALMQGAKLEEGVMAGALPPELLEALKKDGGAGKDALKDLLKDLQLGKGKLANALGKLVDAKLIDAKMLGQCDKAGQPGNSEGLAAFLAENGVEVDSVLAILELAGNGGVDRGRGDAAITFGDEANPEGMKFKDDNLPTLLAGMKNAQLSGVSRSAPEVTGAKETATSGALAGASAGGGEAHVQTVLPRHKGAVQRFFKRDN